MIYGKVLMRPAASEVRSMLHKIKLDNMERARHMIDIQQKSLDFTSNFNDTTPKVKASLDLGMASGSSFSIPSWTDLQFHSVPKVPHNETMGSFTSMPKVVPGKDAEDTDLIYPSEPQSVEECLKTCKEHLANLPDRIERSWKSAKENSSPERETIRVMQWNVLSQALGTKNDNFVRCPPKALNWKTRRFRMLEEIVSQEADIICLQEVDHFRFLQKSLEPLGFKGKFFPKPDSPCLYLPENAGPDGCSIFYRKDKFQLTAMEQRVLEVWHVESNQVVLLACLKSKLSGENIFVATTHLKARNGALLSTLRNEQGKDILDFIERKIKTSLGEGGDDDISQVPVICTGDFNAEPNEPVYKTMISNDNKLRLTSAYAEANSAMEADYTTWKVREDGEHIQTLDYIFHSKDRIKVDKVLECPTGEDIGPDRSPNLSYASDHFSLVADLTLLPPQSKVK